MSRLFRALCTASAAVAACPDDAFSQPSNLPPIVVEGTQPRAKRAAPSGKAKRATTARGTIPAVSAQAPSTDSGPGKSLTVPTTEQARQTIRQTPGGVALVPDTAFKNS